MLTRFACAAGAATLALGLAAPSYATLPTGTLSFIEPSGTVGPNDQVEVWIRYSLDAGSVPLDFSSNPLTGIDAADLPTDGTYDDGSRWKTGTFTEYFGAYLNTYFSCSGTFTTSCITGSNYTFSFWTGSTPGRPSINFLDSFTLAPGASFDYLFGTFEPVAGGAAAGSYTFYNAGLTLNITGQDADGHALRATPLELGATCGSQQAACAFTRTVVGAVPEPGTYVLMALGLVGVVGVVRRHPPRA